MALQKSIASPYGIEANYWRIVRINENFNGNVEVYLAGYASEQARRDGKEPLDVKNFQFDERDATRAGVYSLITESKLDEEGNETNIFAGSEAV